MVQVELNNMYINIGAKSGSEKIMNKKKTLRLSVPQSTPYAKQNPCDFY